MSNGYILGIDIACNNDSSCLTMTCMGCGTVIDSKPFTGEQSEGFEVPSNCPECRAELRRCITIK